MSQQNEITDIKKKILSTGIRVGTAVKTRFMPGTLTNPSLPYYIEPKLVLISDPQVDAQAITEATNAGIPVIGVSNTDNITSKIDLVIPAHNRGMKSMISRRKLQKKRK